MSDPAAGTFEFPGGHLAEGESPRQAALREWQEETGLQFPDGEFTGTWASPDGVYQGFVYTVASESDLDIFSRLPGANPDDPDGDAIEVLAWLDPGQLPGNPAVRPELLASIGQVLAALGVTSAESVEKAGGDPKDQPPPQGAEPATQWPGWQLDLAAIAYWAPLIASALLGAFSAHALVHAYLKQHPNPTPATGPDADAIEQAARVEAVDWAQRESASVQAALARVLNGVWSDGYLIGDASAAAVTDALKAGTPLADATADVGGWVVGDTEAAALLLGERGSGDGLRDLLDRFQITVKSIADSRLEELGRVLADGAARGDSADTITSAIKDLLSNPSRARMIATTELCRASSAAAVQSYKAARFTHKELITAEDDRVCAICDMNAAAGPIPMDAPFPSGEPYGPFHPWDRCAVIPVLDAHEGW